MLLTTGFRRVPAASGRGGSGSCTEVRRRWLPRAADWILGTRRVAHNAGGRQYPTVAVWTHSRITCHEQLNPCTPPHTILTSI